ncbi:MAG: Chromate transport protein ChrA [uncultured Chloroflexia bacterium]|uniref:Chromate transport protein ChrA n=1 Tax=uncultured Chloroflexia bacterium TaxID=1672391 RepID=A0A6J4L6N4_9CHLR|nr:MAG: Chromate transport protein ChrA [uncultured Chloroflexia bacterium]
MVQIDRGEMTDTSTSDETEARGSLAQLTGYFLKLGTIGFGGPVALAGYMQRDLVDERHWISDEDYRLAFALAQISPGPMAAQLAIALGYFKHGVRGATAVGVAFVLPSFLMVLALAAAYVTFGGLWWMQALFYGISAAVIGIIAIAAYKLAGKINGRDPLLWGIFVALAVTTVWAQAELAQLFLIAGLLVLLVHAPPRWLRVRLPFLSVTPWSLLLPSVTWAAFGPRDDVLWDIFLFFVKAGAFVFGSGLAIVPFLYSGIVQDRGWLSEQQFLDAVAVAMITPGPVVITVAFIGYLVAGVPGAVVAAVAIFIPVYVLTIVPAPWFKLHRDNAQLRAFADGATAAASGAIAGAVVVLAQRAIVDIPTALIAIVSLTILWRFKVPEPLLVLAAGGIGLALRPIVG